MNELEKLFGKTNLQTSQTTATTEEETALAEIRKHIEKLKETEEVKKLAETINIDDSESILNFANDVSEKISQVSKDIIAVTGSSNSEEITNMMDTLGRIVKRFSLKDLTYKKPPKGFVAKLMYTVAKKTKATFSQEIKKENEWSTKLFPETQISQSSTEPKTSVIFEILLFHSISQVPLNLLFK